MADVRAESYKLPSHRQCVDVVRHLADILCMDKIKNLRPVYNFRNTCQNCCNDIQFPLLGNFSEGEIIFQTKDGKDFYIAVLIGNKTLDFVKNFLKQNKELLDKETESQKVLALLADKINNKEFTTYYPICPICKAQLRMYGDILRTNKIEIGYAAWTEFESLPESEKIERIKKAVYSLT